MSFQSQSLPRFLMLGGSSCPHPWRGLEGSMLQHLAFAGFFRSTVMVRLGIVMLAGLFHCSPPVLMGQQTDLPHREPAVISSSPDGSFLLRRLQSDSGERGEARKSLEICRRDGKILYSWVSPLGATSAFWSQDSCFLAVNDMPGVSGDQLWVFSLDPKALAVTPIRQPDGKKLRAEVQTRHGNFLSELKSVTLRATHWREGRLWCTVSGTFSPKRQKSVHVPFHHLWILKMNAKESPVLEEEWTRTDPREKPIRDSSP